MRCLLLPVVVILIGLTVLSPARVAESVASTPSERGRDAILRHVMNPRIWSRKAYDNVWKQWGLTEKPADYDRAFRARYGLVEATHENNGLPLGLMQTRDLLGKGIVNNCMMCHTGAVAGQTIVGLGNASLELQGLFDELSAADGLRLQVPFQFSYVRGTIDAVSPAVFLLQLRDPDLNLQKPVALDLGQDIFSRPPAWWLLKRKKTRDWTGGVPARSDRVDLITLLSPLNSGEYIKEQEKVFADILSFLLSVESPRYPFPIDQPLAARGKEIFSDTCARCHGSYGPEGKYPNRIVDLEELRTDPVLAEALPEKTVAYLNKTWLAQQIGPDGKPYRFMANHGYQSPPLDGVWATGPYFHNGSVPTVYHVLNSKARPARYTRSYATGKEDYDPIKLGWKIIELEGPMDPKLPGIERRKIYDTTLRGRGNGGHTFGDKLTEEERMAVIEYLKTL